MQRSILVFENAIKSEYTRKNYLKQLELFLRWSKIKDHDSLLKVSNDQLQIILEDYVMRLKKTVSPNSIPVMFAAIELFFVMNDKNLNFKKIRKMFPQKVKKAGFKAYTTEMVANGIGVSCNTAQIHLYKLQAEGKIKGKRVGRQNQWMRVKK